MEWQRCDVACPRCGIIVETYGVAFKIEKGALAIKIDGKCHNCDLFVELETDVEERAERCLASYGSSRSFVADGSRMVN